MVCISCIVDLLHCCTIVDIVLLQSEKNIHWHRLKDEDVVRDIFWTHPDVVKLNNACNLVFLIDNT